MEIRDHAKERYVQRVMGIADKEEAKRYIKENEFEVAYKVLGFINDAKLLHKNYAPGRRDTCDYYINGEMLIIIGSDKKEVITMHDITLDSDSEMNSQRIREYVKMIKQNNVEITKINSIKEKQDLASKNIEFMIKNFGISLENLKVAFEYSKEKCVEYAKQTKDLRMQNREMMSEMFKKIE